MRKQKPKSDEEATQYTPKGLPIPVPTRNEGRRSPGQGRLPGQDTAHWLMVSEVAGRVVVVPLAPSDSGDRAKCRPVGRYLAAQELARRYREDR